MNKKYFSKMTNEEIINLFNQASTNYAIKQELINNFFEGAPISIYNNLFNKETIKMMLNLNEKNVTNSLISYLIDKKEIKILFDITGGKNIINIKNNVLDDLIKEEKWCIISNIFKVYVKHKIKRFINLDSFINNLDKILTNVDNFSIFEIVYDAEYDLDYLGKMLINNKAINWGLVINQVGLLSFIRKHKINNENFKSIETLITLSDLRDSNTLKL